MKNKIYKILTVTVLVIFVSACGNKENDTHSHMDEQRTEAKEEHSESDEVLLTQKQFDALKMKIDTLAFRNMSGYVLANGALEVPPQNEAAITSFVGANVVSINVIEGDKVNKGQAVAYLSHPNIIKLQTDYLNALSNSNFLKKNFERQKKLYEEGVGSGANFQKADAEYQVSKALVNGLEAQLKILNINTTSIRKGKIVQRIPLQSPIEGFVQKVEVKTGQYVEPQTEMFEIINTDHVHADLMVFEKDVHKVRKGQKINFKVQSFPDSELTAEIYSVSKTFEDSPKAVHVHAEIINKKGNLIPGMYIQGKIQTNEIQSKALPESAIVKEGDRFLAFTVNKEGELWSFAPIEVVIENKDGVWVSIKFLNEINSNTQFAFNNAYYLNAEMKKGETEHEH